MDLAEHLKRIEVDEGAYQILSRKGSFRVLAARGLSSMEALIIKQEMLARGGDAAIPRLALRCDRRPQEILILGTHAQILSLVRNLKGQPFRLGQLADHDRGSFGADRQPRALQVIYCRFWELKRTW